MTKIIEFLPNDQPEYHEKAVYDVCMFVLREDIVPAMIELRDP